MMIRCYSSYGTEVMLGIGALKRYITSRFKDDLVGDRCRQRSPILACFAGRGGSSHSHFSVVE